MGDLTISDVISIKHALENMLTNKSKFPDGELCSGLKTGFAVLDKKIGGIKPGELVVLAGDTCMGKTAFASQIAVELAAKENGPILFFYLEGTVSCFTSRLISSLSKIELKDNAISVLDEPGQNVETSSIDVIAEFLTNLPLYIASPSDFTFEEISEKMKAFIKLHGLPKFIVIDFLQRLKLKKENNSRYDEISEICRSIKDTALNLNIPILLLSQVGKELSERYGLFKRPHLSDIDSFGCLKNEADTILLIHRDKNWLGENIAEIAIAKQRNGGGLSRIKLYFSEEIGFFQNISEEQHSAEDDDSFGY